MSKYNVNVTMSGITTMPNVYTGTGTPEGVVTAAVGSMYIATDGGSGTTFYVKKTGTGNTGWSAI